jgi:hypothetical protein
MKNREGQYNSIRHEAQILRRLTAQRVKPSGKVYKRSAGKNVSY